MPANAADFVSGATDGAFDGTVEIVDGTAVGLVFLGDVAPTCAEVAFASIDNAPKIKVVAIAPVMVTFNHRCVMACPSPVSTQ
jgi:hypothetical protein